MSMLRGLLAAVVLVGVSCGGGGGGGGKAAGEEGGACYPNQTCNSPLICSLPSRLCVQPSTGTGGAGDGAGTTGSGGMGGAAGTMGTAGQGGGGGSGSPFCSDWAALFCRRIWMCDPDAASNPFALGSEAQCATGYAGLCSQPQPAGQTFDVNCYGKQVNEAAKTSCLNRLGTASCAELNAATYDDDCDLVCTS